MSASAILRKPGLAFNGMRKNRITTINSQIINPQEKQAHFGHLIERVIKWFVMMVMKFMPPIISGSLMDIHAKAGSFIDANLQLGKGGLDKAWNGVRSLSDVIPPVSLPTVSIPGAIADPSAATTTAISKLPPIPPVPKVSLPLKDFPDEGTYADHVRGLKSKVVPLIDTCANAGKGLVRSAGLENLSNGTNEGLSNSAFLNAKKQRLLLDAEKNETVPINSQSTDPTTAVTDDDEEIFDPEETPTEVPILPRGVTINEENDDFESSNVTLPNEPEVTGTSDSKKTVEPSENENNETITLGKPEEPLEPVGPVEPGDEESSPVTKPDDDVTTLVGPVEPDGEGSSPVTKPDDEVTTLAGPVESSDSPTTKLPVIEPEENLTTVGHVEISTSTRPISEKSSVTVSSQNLTTTKGKKKSSESKSDEKEHKKSHSHEKHNGNGHGHGHGKKHGNGKDHKHGHDHKKHKNRRPNW